MANEAVAARTAATFLGRCADMDVDCIVTTSPLCHTALDIYQARAGRAVGRTFDIPVLHVEQLLALGLGAAPKDVGLDRHMVSTARLADRLDERRLLPA